MKAFTEEINREGLDNGESLLQSCRRLLYAGSHGKYSDTLNDIKDNYPRFYRYLQINGFPHESLFAGYARRGVLHFDNHTNNTLERYHHTIKSVTGSSQISVGLLVDRLHKLLSVRMMSWQQANFNSQMRSKPFTADVVAGYSGKVSKFALERISYEYHKSADGQLSSTQNADGTISVGNYTCTLTNCMCGAWTGFHLPCRHIFFIRQQQGCDEVDTALVDSRWLLPCANTNSGTAHNSTGRVVVCNLPVAAETNGQRFKSLMSVFTPMASAPAELSRSEFAKYMEWVSGLELQVRDGTWRDNLTIPHVPSSDGNDDAASSELTTSSHTMHSLSDGQADNRFDGEAMSVPDGARQTTILTLSRKMSVTHRYLYPHQQRVHSNCHVGFSSVADLH